MPTQSDYVKALRPHLPPEAFAPSFNKLIILSINLLILCLGWTIAQDLPLWSPSWLWLYLPLTLIMGNSIIVLLFTTHDMMHGSVIKNPRLADSIALLGLTLLWMPPTLWKSVHNRQHHSQTNSLQDPDRSYLADQTKTWGKWIQNLVIPSAEVNGLFLAFGMATAWGTHTFRHLTSILFFNHGDVDYVPAAVVVSAKKRRMIAIETIAIAAIHLSILWYIHNPIGILLGYLLPIFIGYAGVMFYIYTNHFLCPMTEVNDPLLNSVSLRMPKIFDLLHFNFSYHTEHHIFPGLNSDYYPAVQELLQTHYPDRFNLIPGAKAWQLLLSTPRHYRDCHTLTDWKAQKTATCPTVSKIVGKAHT
jgi:fatty acid desaturase